MNIRETSMMKTQNRFAKSALATALAGAIVATGTASASIAQAPLFLNTPVDPNVMFIIDDSGSMYWSFMPDDIYGFRNTNRAKSSEFNAVYYNPEVTYSAPVDHNGNSLGDADFNNAWFNGYSSNRDNNTVNLSTSFRPTWYYSGTWTEYAGGAEPAYYYEYNPQCGNTNNDTCYGKVTIDADEQQNFANWYSYYRSRMYTSRAAIGAAFSGFSTEFRIGWGRINKGFSYVDGVGVRGVEQGVRSFDINHKEAFYDWLYDVNPTGGTPLRRALDGAGQYYESNDSRGPWSTTPGEAGGEDLTCRNSYTILMTDGYWGGSSPSGIGNADGSFGPSITAPDGTTFQYTPEDPYRDGYSNTLADVAMHYWKRDLRTDLDNEVPTTAANEAFWQHMATFGVGLGVEGSIDPDDAWAAVPTGDSINWPNPTSSNAAKIDDLLHTGVNSRGGFFSTSDPEEFSQELSGVLDNIASRTGNAVASVATDSTEVRPDGVNMAFQARFNSADWSGDLVALELDFQQLEFVDDWKASEQLPQPAARNIYTWDGTQGVSFAWNNLPTDYQTALGSEAVLNYLRGSDANELQNNGAFRNRSNPIGDIINSNPQFQSASLNYGYSMLDDYYQFRVDNQDRTEAVYVGSNAGMLHAFDADDGTELFAYVPSMLQDYLADLTDPNYDHRFYVDGQQYVAHAEIDGDWSTVLVGTLGAGGKGVYALDVTEPDNFNPATDVLWEISADDNPHIGHVMGEVTVARLPDDNWYAIFGNGYASDSGEAALVIVGLEDGDIQTIDVGGADNGLSTPVFQYDTSRRLTQGFAGDLEGNLWQFDLTSDNSNQWDSAYSQGNTPQPLFAANRPITAKPAVGSYPHEGGGSIVLFGTGKYFEQGDNAIEDNPPVDTFYGVRFGNDVQGNPKLPYDRSDLVEQWFTSEQMVDDTMVRTSTDFEADTDSQGWFIDLNYPSNNGERVVQPPQLIDGRVEFTTLIPSDDPCTGGGVSGLVGLNAASGARPENPIFDLNGDLEFDESDMVVVNGELVPPSMIDPGVGVPGAPSYVFNPVDGLVYRIISGTDGYEIIPAESSSAGTTWRQLR